MRFLEQQFKDIILEDFITNQLLSNLNVKKYFPSVLKRNLQLLVLIIDQSDVYKHERKLGIILSISFYTFAENLVETGLLKMKFIRATAITKRLRPYSMSPNWTCLLKFRNLAIKFMSINSSQKRKEKMVPVLEGKTVSLFIRISIHSIKRNMYSGAGNLVGFL